MSSKKFMLFSSNLDFSEIPILESWDNGEYIIFFIKYLQLHTYIKSKHIIKDFFRKIELNDMLTNEYYRQFLIRQNRYIKKALDMGYLEFYNSVTYKHTEKVQNPEPLIKALKKIKFKR